MSKNFSYAEQLRGLEIAKHQYESVIALLRYEDDRMIELNKLRTVSSIDILIEELSELKEKLSK